MRLVLHSEFLQMCSTSSFILSQIRSSDRVRMTSSKVFVVAVLCSFILLSTFLSSSESASCCMRYTKHRLSCKILQGYTIQNVSGSCDIDAIIFHIPGRFLCADPTQRWTQKGMKCVDERRRKAAQVLTKTADTVSLPLVNASNPQTSV